MKNLICSPIQIIKYISSCSFFLLEITGDIFKSLLEQIWVLKRQIVLSKVCLFYLMFEYTPRKYLYKTFKENTAAKPGTVVLHCNSSTGEAEEGRLP